MFEVPYGQDPYSAIGRYIRENITAIEDIIAVIDIDDVETNELFLVDMDADGYFVWKSDWWEGEKNVSLVDFFPVSDAKRPSAQPERKKGKWISLDDFRGKYNEFGYKCSECGEQSDYDENFCANCGAQMERGET